MKARNCEEFLPGSGVAENNSSGAMAIRREANIRRVILIEGCYTGFGRVDARWWWGWRDFLVTVIADGKRNGGVKHGLNSRFLTRLEKAAGSE